MSETLFTNPDSDSELFNRLSQARALSNESARDVSALFPENEDEGFHSRVDTHYTTVDDGPDGVLVVERDRTQNHHTEYTIYRGVQTEDGMQNEVVATTAPFDGHVERFYRFKEFGGDRLPHLDAAEQNAAEFSKAVHHVIDAAFGEQIDKR